MKLYLFNGSAHKRGNAERLWRVFELEARTKRGHTIHYNGKIPSPCINCGMCAVNGKCSIDDKMFQYGLNDCDGIVILSPIYFFSFSAKAKLFLDRLYSTNLSGKILTAITLSGSDTESRYCGFDIVSDTLKRTSEYCGSVYVEPVNFVTGDKKIEYPVSDRLSEFIDRLEVAYNEAGC